MVWKRHAAGVLMARQWKTAQEVTNIAARSTETPAVQMTGVYERLGSVESRMKPARGEPTQIAIPPTAYISPIMDAIVCVPIRFEGTKDKVSKYEFMNIGPCLSIFIFRTYRRTRQLPQGLKRYSILVAKIE